MMESENLSSRLALAALLLGAASASPIAMAQDASGEIGAVQRLERDQLDRMRQEQRLQRTPSTPSIELPAPTPQGSASKEANIKVTRFQVDPHSAILSEAQIREALAPYENRTLSLYDLFQAVAALNRAYDDLHMPTARAVLPPQEIRDGVVHIRLVEAKVGQLTVQPSDMVSPEFVQQRLRVREGTLLSVPELEADMARFNHLHQSQLRASVQAGTAPGTTDVDIQTLDPQPYRFTAFTDNAGRKSVGEWRAGVLAQWNGLGRRDDTLSFSALAAEGTQSGSLAYSVPVTAQDTRLDLSYSQDRIHVIDGPFKSLDIGGTSHTMSLGLTQPFVADARHLLQGYARVSHKNSESTFSGVVQQRASLNMVTVGASGDWLSDDAVWTWDLNGNVGKESRDGLGQDFNVWRGSTAMLLTLAPGTQLVLRADGQYSPTDLLPTLEQYQLGGSASVRGYSEGLLSGRSGYLLSSELRQVLVTGQGRAFWEPQVSGLLFVDHGAAFPFRPGRSDTTGNDFLTSAGVGTAIDWGDHARLRLTLGWPLNSVSDDTDRRSPRLLALFSMSLP